jgi:hypothetical protein
MAPRKPKGALTKMDQLLIVDNFSFPCRVAVMVEFIRVVEKVL